MSNEQDLQVLDITSFVIEDDIRNVEGPNNSVRNKRKRYNLRNKKDDPQEKSPRKRKSENEVQATPKKRKRKEKLQTDYGEAQDPSCNRFGDCAICMDELGVKPMASTKCGHVFCQECLMMSLKKEKKCPTCRCVLRGKMAYHPLYL